ncbi:MAG: hypothetical protein EBY59_00040 [Proteobacteria bacterium]|nr:hypothetical protein [Pseudomonadota bacterium]
MLKLRLSRGGTKKRPVYKVVVADSRFARAANGNNPNKAVPKKDRKKEGEEAAPAAEAPKAEAAPAAEAPKEEGK